MDAERTADHPAPILTELDVQGWNGTLLLLRQVLGPSRVLEILAGPSGPILTKTGKPAQSRDDLHSPADLERWYESFNTLPKHLIEFKNLRAGPAGYSPHLLLCKTAASNSYRAAVETIYRLGRYRAHSAGASQSVRDSMIASGHILARLSRCHCWTAYLWRSGAVLPSMVAAHGLWYPEALIGLPANMHSKFFGLDEIPSPVSEEPTNKSNFASFQVREEIVKCWSVRLHASGVRAVVFLNWRASSDIPGPDRHALDEAASPPWMEDSIREPHGLTRKRDASVLLDALRPRVTHPECLVQSARIMSGWLQEQVIRASTRRTSVPVLSISNFQHRVFSEFRALLTGQENRKSHSNPLTAERTEGLRLAASGLLGGGDSAVPRVYAVETRAGKTTIDYGKQQLANWRGELLTSTHVTVSPKLPRWLVPEASGISAHAIAWQTSILMNKVQDVSGTWVPHETALRRRLLSNANSPAGKSELAVPVFAGTVPVGVIGVASPIGGTLSIDLVRKLEVFSLLIGSLSRLCKLRFRDDVHHNLYDTFALENDAPWDEPMLWSRFSRWARDFVGADMSHVATWGESGSICRSGVSVSTALLSEFQDRVVKAKESGQYRVDRSASSEALACLEANDRVVREYGVAMMLRAQAGATTKEVLQGKRRVNEIDHGTVEPTWLGESLKYSIGFGVSPHPSFNPTACLWLGWASAERYAKPAKELMEYIDAVGNVYSTLVLFHHLHELLDSHMR